MITKNRNQSFESSCVLKNIYLVLLVALFLLELPILLSQVSPVSVYSYITRLDSSHVIYRNPRVYNVEISFEIVPDITKINRDRDLKVWILIPREWDSQKNVQIISIQPEPHSQFTDPEYGNKIFYWDFGKYPIKPSYQVNILARLISYEVHTMIDPSNIKPYDKTSKEYELYTQSGYTIHITPKVKELAKAAIGNETNPYLQAHRILTFVHKKIRYYQGMNFSLDYMFSTSKIDERSGEEYFTGDCGHYSALFVALCRSEGIPARCVYGRIGWRPFLNEENSKMYSKLDTVLTDDGFAGAQHHGLGPHMWAEFYLQHIGWVPLDPTAGIFGQLYGVKAIMGKGRDIQLGPEAPQTRDDGYGSQFMLIRDGRVDYPLYGVYNIASIQTAKVKIIHLSDKKQIIEEFYKTILEQDLEHTKRQYQELKANFPDEYDFSKEQLIMLGNKLRIEKRVKEAIGIYDWIIELHPDWWGGYKGIADVYNYKGNKQKAIKYYAKSLELNPTILNARIIIELLKELIE